MNWQETSASVGITHEFNVPGDARDIALIGDVSSFTWVKIFHDGPGGDGDLPPWLHNSGANYQIDGICTKVWGTFTNPKHGNC